MNAAIARRAPAWVAACLLAASGRLAAIIASPSPVDLAQPDGTVVRLTIHGDEFHHWFEDARGFSVVRDAARRYVYARPDAGGRPEPSRLVAGRADPAAAGLAPGLLRKPAAAVPRWGRGQRLPGPPPAASPPAAGDGPAPSPPTVDRVPPAGTVRNLVVLCRFADHATGAHTRPQADFDTLFNAPGGDPALAPTGSVRDYYAETSYGTMTLQSTVVAWVTLANNEAYYADGKDGTGGTYPKNAQGMVKDALDLVDPLVNFGGFDQDNDGYIDAITIIHSGYGAETGGGGGNWIWSHRWALWQVPGGQWTSGDNNSAGAKVKVYDYHTEPALWGTSGTDIVRIGVICHETGHFFGLPDLYDTDNSSQGAGSWCLMANSWGFDGSQLHPPHFCAWCKVQLGWVTPTTASAGGQSLPRVAASPAVLKITNGFPDGEYLLVENRQPYGFENIIPQGGLAVWHVDEAKANNNEEGYPGQAGWPSNNKHYGVALLQADGLCGLERNLGRGDAGDLYRAGGASALTPATVPGTDRYQGGTVAASNNSLTGIGAAGDTMTFTLNGAAGVPVITSPAAASGAPGVAFSYQITATNSPTGYHAAGLPAGLAVDAGSGLITGTPVAEGTSSVGLGATNAAGTGTATLTLTIARAITLAEALDTPGWSWTSGGDNPWGGQSAVTSDGLDAARSGTLGDGQSSWVQTMVTGPGTLNFRCATSSEAGYDFLRFTLDGAAQPSAAPLSGETGWQQRSVIIPAGSHTVRWTYAKDVSVAAGADAAWLDTVSFVAGQEAPVITSATAAGAVLGQAFVYQITASNDPTGFGADNLPAGLAVDTGTGVISGVPGAAGSFSVGLSASNGAGTGTATLALTVTATALTLAEALDAEALPWSAGGAAGWQPQTGVAHDGADAARSGALGDSQASWVQTVVAGPGTLAFWWRVSSEAGYDVLRFTVDGVEPAAAPAVSGEVGWQQRTVNIPAGVHTLQWSYTKDISVAGGADAAWLDQVSFAAGQLAPVITSATTAAAILDQPFSYQITAANGPTGFGAAGLPAGLAVDPAGGLISGAPTATGTFAVALSASNGAGTGSATLALTVAASALTLGEALDAPLLAWSTGAAAGWQPQTGVTHDGLDAARSGTLGNSQESWLATTVSGPGTLGFWWRVSSEAGYDVLRFTLDGIEQAAVPAISGEPGWQPCTLAIPAGPHLLLWSYVKDYSLAAGLDAGWLDQVTFTADDPVVVQEFTSSGGLDIPSYGSATPHPSTIEVGGVEGTVTALRVKLNALTHTYPDDLDVLLMAPDGRVCALMSDAGNGYGVFLTNLVLDDSAAAALPDASQIISAGYRPANHGTAEPLPPGGSGVMGTNLMALTAGGVNGSWKLFVDDDAAGDSGSLGSWAIAVETTGGAGSLLVLPAAAEQANGLNTPVRDAPRTLQYVFGSSLLAGVPPGSEIGGIAFRLDGGAAGWPSGSRTWSAFDVQLCRAANPAGALAASFADNLGGDVVTVRSGPLTVAAGAYQGWATPNPFGPEIVFTTPYTYSGGDLLVTIRHTGNGVDSAYLDAADDSPGLWQGIYGAGFAATTSDDSVGVPVTRLRWRPGTLTALQGWRLGHFGTAAGAGDAANDADPDHDGAVNLLEFAFNMDPHSPLRAPVAAAGHSGMPAGELADDGGTPRLRLRFVRLKEVPGLSYEARFGDAPDALAPAAGEAVVVASDATTETVEVWDAAAAATTHPRRFGQVVVSYAGGE